MTDGLKMRFQLSARLRNGAVVRLPRSSGIARLLFFDSYSAYENRPKNLSFAEMFQSTRASA